MIFVLLALFGASGCGGDRVVEKPQYLARSVDFMEISRVTLTAEKTVFAIDASACGDVLTGLSKEVCLVADGKTYGLQDATVALPKSFLGKEELVSPYFELEFPALPAEVRTVDMILHQSSKSLSLAIWGIRLDGEKYDGTAEVPADLLKWNPDNGREWREPVVRAGDTWLEIHWLGYAPGLGLPKVSRLGIHPWSEEVAVSDEGVSVVEFDQYVTATVRLSLAGRDFDLVLDPGDRGVLYVDVAKAFMCDSPYFHDDRGRFAYYAGGERTDLNNRLLNRVKADTFLLDVRWDATKEMDEKGYVELCVGMYKEDVANLEADRSMSPEYCRYWELEAGLACVERVNMIRVNMMDVYGWKLGDPRLKQLTKARFAPLKRVGLNDYDLLMMDCEPLAKMLREFSASAELENCFGKGFLSDFYLAKDFGPRFMRRLPMNEEQLQAVSDATPEGKRLFDAIYTGSQAAWKRHIAKPGYRIVDAPKVEDEELFEALIEPYRGRVLLIDFWYTACVPCVKAMKLIKPLKEEFKDEPVSYLYLTGEHSSALEIWRQMIPDIGGDHCRLPRKQDKYLMKQFEIPGAPYYILVDKYGKVVYQGVGFMGVDKLREMLKQELAK